MLTQELRGEGSSGLQKKDEKRIKKEQNIQVAQMSRGKLM
jgi:hypothetical protein